MLDADWGYAAAPPQQVSMGYHPRGYYEKQPFV